MGYIVAILDIKIEELKKVFIHLKTTTPLPVNINDIFTNEKQLYFLEQGMLVIRVALFHIKKNIFNVWLNRRQWILRSVHPICGDTMSCGL